MRRRPSLPRLAGDDGGFTLVELIVTMTLALIVLFAVLQGSEVFARVTQTANDTSQAQDTARTSLRQIVQTLRQGRRPAGTTTPVASSFAATRRDLVVAAWVTGASNPAPGTTAGWIRYCATGDGRSLLVGVRAQSAYAAPGACALTDTTGGWTYGALVSGTLRDPGKLFDYSSGSCVGGRTVGSATAAACTPAANVTTTVGVRISIARTSVADAATSIVRGAVAVRNGSSS